MTGLKRVREPEFMDTEIEASDYDSMDHSAVNQAFVADLLAAGFSGGDVLDVGTGTALIPIEICNVVPECRIMAIDMATHMLDIGRYNIEAAGFIQSITLAQVDAKKMPYADGTFDTLVSNSIIHHIPDPQECAAEMVRVTRRGGLVFVRDLMRPESDSTVRHLVETYAGDENEHQKKMFDDSLRAALSLAEIRMIVKGCGIDPDSVNPTSDRHWTWNARIPE